MPELSSRVEFTSQSRCRFALAWGDVTPPGDIYHRMWGAARHERATGVHRPLRSTVAVFEPLNGNGGRQVLVALDHCVMGAVELRQLLDRVAAGGGVSEDEVLVVFSHTHGAGLMGLDRSGLPGGDLIGPYLEWLGQVTGELVKECLDKVTPCTLAYGRGKCGLATHRDFWDGEQYVCGYNPGVPVDDTVMVVKVVDDAGVQRASIVNYACHPTTLAWDNTLISPDYIGAMREVVERETGVPCLFLQGASGELGPREGFVGDVAVADRNGRELGFAALSALTSLGPAGTKFVYQGPVVSGATLGAWAHVPLSEEDIFAQGNWSVSRWKEPLKYRDGRPTVELTSAEMAEYHFKEEIARSNGDMVAAAEHRAMVERKSRMLHRLEQLPAGECYPLQVVLWKMGDAVWVGVQGESYSRLQTELRAAFPDKAIIVASIAGDWGASYLPPRELYDTGIYQESIAVVAAGSLEQLISSISNRIAE